MELEPATAAVDAGLPLPPQRRPRPPELLLERAPELPPPHLR